jgi:F-type H+-transporting ATPase subunit b
MLTRLAFACVVALALIAGRGMQVSAQDAPTPAAEVASEGEVAPADAAHASGEHAAGEHAEHAHIGEAGVNMDPQEWKADLAIYTFLVFLVLLAILTKFAWKPINQALEAREHRIADHIAAAERQNAEAKAMLAEYERKLAAAQDQVRAILDEARKDAEHAHQELLAHARSEAQAEMDRAKREIDTAKGQALKELAEKSTDLAIGLAGRIVSRELQNVDHARLVQEAIAGLPSGDASRN